jgi:hypothetical protein
MSILEGSELEGFKTLSISVPGPCSVRLYLHKHVVLSVMNNDTGHLKHSVRGSGESNSKCSHLCVAVIGITVMCVEELMDLILNLLLMHSAQDGNLEVPVYFLKAKEGYTITKMEKD